MTEQSLFNGTFDKKSKLASFLDPIKTLSSLMGEEGIVLNIEATEKTISIYAKNTASGILAHIKYKPELFSGFNFTDDAKVGIMKVPDFVRYFSVLSEDSVSVNFQDNTFFIEHEQGSLSFRTADPSLIDEAPKTFKGATWFTSIKMDINKFSKLKKAMSVLSEEDCIFVNGQADKSKLIFTVRSHSVELNAYRVGIDATITDMFDTPYRKDIWQLILSSTSDDITVSFGQKLAKFDIKSEYCDVTYFVARKS